MAGTTKKNEGCEVIMSKNTIILLEMTAQDWIRNADIPYNVKNGFTLLAGDIESYLSGRYNYKTGWDKNEDVFIRIFGKSPIDKTHFRRISLRVSFHRRFIEVCYDGLEICSMYISEAKAPVVGFRSVPNTWTEVIGIQKVFNELFGSTFKRRM